MMAPGMKHRFTFLGALVLASLAGPAAASRSLFDFDWRFAHGDVAGAEKTEFVDAQWPAVDLPHDFCISGPFDRTLKDGTRNGFRPPGIGWYRKSFVTPEEQCVRLDFEGVFREAQVWVNGSLVATHNHGYHGFECDLTPHLKPPGRTNVVAVRADSSKPPSVTWYSGGGIYRHVWLLTSGQAHVVRHGTCVTTPEISSKEARVKIRTELQGSTEATLVSEVYEAGGKLVGTVQTAGTSSFAQEVMVPEPKLWNLTNPAMYRLVSRVIVDGRESDRCETPFGIREIRLTPDGLFLNGRRELVKGFNIHHDLGCLGVAAFDRAIERRLATIKAIGCSAVRLAHNPHAPALLDLCDRMGLLVFDEAFCNWGDMTQGEFAQTWPTCLEEFVRRDRNHPSVFVWSVGNQVSASERAPDFGCNAYDAMAAVVHRLDPTRPATTALRPHRKEGTDLHPLALRMDVMSANYMEKWFAKDRLNHPKLMFIASECTTGDSGRSPWRDLDREHAVGLFYWGGIDYLGESQGWPVKCWKGGFVDWAGFRKPSSWVLESLISDQPVVRLLVHRPETTYTNWDGVVISVSGLLAHWNRPPAGNQSIEVVSNAEEVELLLNGGSLGTKRGSPSYWTVPWQPGTLAAVARNAGREVARHELKTAGAPQSLRLTPDRLSLHADGQDLSHITVEVVDAHGIVVPDASHLITVEVTGPGTNAGVQNSDPTSDELFQADRHPAYEGRMLLVVRSKRHPGSTTVKAAAEGLEPATVILNTN